MDKNSNLD